VCSLFQSRLHLVSSDIIPSDPTASKEFINDDDAKTYAKAGLFALGAKALAEATSDTTTAIFILFEICCSSI
jgi:hypothetical protein